MRLEEEDIRHTVMTGDCIRQAYATDVAAMISLISAAAQLHAQTPRVRLEGDAQPTAAVAALLALPHGVRWLELAVNPCAGPLLPALARFSRLQRLSITGNGADVHWAVGPPAVLAPCEHLCLDYRRAPRAYLDGSVDRSIVESPPQTVCRALAAATALHTLELRVSWSDEVEALFRALPGLRSFSLHVYNCTDDDASAAVCMLRPLTQLTSLFLGIHCYAGCELDYDFPGGDDWPHRVQLEPPASLTALTELCLVELVELPPDFCQLSNLQRLSVTQGHSWGYDPFEWGPQPLTGLGSLTRVELVQGENGMELPDPAVLASAPRLTEVHAVESRPDQQAEVAAWRAQLAALRPDLHITPTPLPEGNQQ